MYCKNILSGLSQLMWFSIINNAKNTRAHATCNTQHASAVKLLELGRFFLVTQMQSNSEVTTFFIQKSLVLALVLNIA